MKRFLVFITFVSMLSGCGALSFRYEETNLQAVNEAPADSQGAALKSGESDKSTSDPSESPADEGVNPLAKEMANFAESREYRQEAKNTSVSPDNDEMMISPNADKVLYAYEKDGKWGLINGFAEIVMEPEHVMVTPVGRGRNETIIYLVSDNAEKPFTGMLYSASGERALDTEVGLIGGGPDCNTSHIRGDVFTYEENGKLGLIAISGKKVTPAVYDSIRDDYDRRFMHAKAGDITYYLTQEGRIETPDIPGVSLMGLGDRLDFEYSYIRDNTGVTTVYKGAEAVFKTEYRIEQVEGGFFEYTENGMNTYDMDFNKLHAFPPEYVYYIEGPLGAETFSGYLLFEKGGRYILADNYGKELVNMDEYFYAVKEGEYLRISLYENSDERPDLLYDLEGNFIKEADNKKDEPPADSENKFIYTAFYSEYDPGVYFVYYTGWFEFVTEDSQYSFPYNTEEYLATWVK